MNVTKSYVEEVIARLEGNSDKAVAARNFRKANSAVKGQLAALEATRVDEEVALEDAQEALGNAKYPTTPIGDNQAYIQGISSAQLVVDQKEADLKTTDESIKYFKGLQEDFSKKD